MNHEALDKVLQSLPHLMDNLLFLMYVNLERVQYPIKIFSFLILKEFIYIIDLNFNKL